MADRVLKRPMFRRGGVANEGIMSGLVDRSVSSDATSGGLNSLVRPGYAEGDVVEDEKGGFWNSIVGRTLKAPVDFLAKPVANVINPAINALVGTEFEQMRTPYDAMDAWTWNKLDLGQHDIYNPDGDPETDDFKDRTDWGYANLGTGGHKDPDAVEWEDEDPDLNQPKIVGNETGTPPTSRADDITAIYEELLPMLQGTLGVDKDALGRQKYLELAKFGANLMAQPGGSLTRAIGKAAEQPLEGLTRIAETKRKGKRAPAEIAMKIALQETQAGPVGKQIRDLKKVYPQRKGETANEWNKRIGDKVLDRGTATKQQTAESRGQNNIKLLENDLDPLPRGKAARSIAATGLDLSYFEMWPKDEKDAVDGQHYITKTGKLRLVDGKDVLEWNPKKQKFE